MDFIMKIVSYGVGVIAPILGLAMFYDGISRYLLKQKIKNTPTSKIRSAAVGLVEVIGSVQPNQKFFSPITNTQCGYWVIKAQIYGKKARNRKGWNTFYTKSSVENFYLEDETGKILIDPNGAKVDLIAGTKQNREFAGKIYASDGKLTDAAAKFLAAYPEAEKEFTKRKNANMQIVEYCLAEGDAVYVLGTAEPAQTSSGMASENLILKKGRDGVLHIFNSPETNIAEYLDSFIFGDFFVGTVLIIVGLVFLIGALQG